MTQTLLTAWKGGTDVLKALALGARFVWVGRPFNYAAAVAGQAGTAAAIGGVDAGGHRAAGISARSA